MYSQSNSFNRPLAPRAAGRPSLHTPGSVCGTRPSSPAGLTFAPIGRETSGDQLQYSRGLVSVVVNSVSFTFLGSLCSIGITRLLRYYGPSDSCRTVCGRLGLSGRSPYFTHPIFRPFRLQPPDTVLSSLPHVISATGFLHPYGSQSLRKHPQVWTSRAASSLVTVPGRIEFVILSAAADSPSVALHPSSRRRSYSSATYLTCRYEKDFHLPDWMRLQAHWHEHLARGSTIETAREHE